MRGGFFLWMALGALLTAWPARATDSMAQRMTKAIEAAEGEVVIPLSQDYRGEAEGHGMRTAFYNEKDAHIIIDGQGHAIDGMYLAVGRYTLRNCTLVPIPADADKRPGSSPFPGLELGMGGGDLHVTLEDTVLLQTGPDEGSAPVEVWLAGIEHQAPYRVRLDNHARAAGEGIGVGYRLLNEYAPQLRLTGGSGVLYAFLWGQPGDVEGMADVPAAPPQLLTDATVSCRLEPARQVWADTGAPPEAERVEKKNLLPFRLETLQ